MSDTVIWIIVAAVVVLAVLAVLVLAIRAKQRKDVEHRRADAEELRRKATAAGPDLTEAQLRAQEADAQSQLAAREAERAEQAAEEERQRVAAEEAHREHLVREADRLDPDVDHAADDYRPEADGPRPTNGSGGAHRA